MANLYIVCGLPGVGKTTVAKKIARKTKSILLRTDVIRKEIRLLGYTEKEKEQVYNEMFLRAQKLLRTGKNVVLDATFAKKKNRLAAKRTAARTGADFQTIEVVCPVRLVKKRLSKRTKDASQAGFKHYLEHKKFFEPIKEKHTVINTAKQG